MLGQACLDWRELGPYDRQQLSGVHVDIQPPASISRAGGASPARPRETPSTSDPRDQIRRSRM
jgi:hypothetical protein